MKKYVCLLIAALMLLAVGCGKTDKPDTGSNGDTKRIDGTAAPDAGQKTDAEEEFSMKFDGLTLTAGDFNWQFFLAKVSANIDARIKVYANDSGDNPTFILTYTDGKYTVENASGTTSYANMVSFEHSSLEGSYKITVLTNNKDMTADKFFGVALANVSVGDTNPNGIIVYAEKL